MAQVRLRAEAKQLHRGRVLYTGDEFSTSEAEAADLVAMRFASVVAQVAAYADKAEHAEPAPHRGRPAKKTTTYRRRDMRAEG
jgi:hypothetical protein